MNEKELQPTPDREYSVSGNSRYAIRASFVLHSLVSPLITNVSHLKINKHILCPYEIYKLKFTLG
jgi:hypothetical protein